jgi:carbon storage regulator
MLVLSRKVGERLLIGDQIAITVVRIQGGSVRIGVEAPPHLAVVREELKARFDEQRLEEQLSPDQDHETPPAS